MTFTGYYDLNGIPIYSGDLLRSFHYCDRSRSRRKVYLYHVVCDMPDGVKLLPVSWLNPSQDRYGGGSCNLIAIVNSDGIVSAEVIHGSCLKYGGNLTIWYEREKKPASINV